MEKCAKPVVAGNFGVFNFFVLACKMADYKIILIKIVFFLKFAQGKYLSFMKKLNDKKVIVAC